MKIKYIETASKAILEINNTDVSSVPTSDLKDLFKRTIKNIKDRRLLLSMLPKLRKNTKNSNVETPEYRYSLLYEVNE